jgi:hypothetical protein
MLLWVEFVCFHDKRYLGSYYTFLFSLLWNWLNFKQSRVLISESNKKLAVHLLTRYMFLMKGNEKNWLSSDLSVCLSAMELSSRFNLGVATIWLWTALVLLLHNSRGVVSDSKYLIGLGSSDITGPAADANMMGYANTEQTASGIHFRLRARTFIVAEPKGNRVVFVNLDACMGSQLVTIKVIERLKARYLIYCHKLWITFVISAYLLIE